MATIQLHPTAAKRAAASWDVPQQALIVECRQSWADVWQAVPYLQPLRLVSSLAPGMSSAQFRWRYGEVMWEDWGGFAWQDPQDLINYFVRVRVADAWSSEPRDLWYGVITEQAFDVHGAKVQDGGSDRASGWQVLEAYGLECLLDRVRVYQAKHNDNLAETTFGWCPTFNRAHPLGFGLVGNRSAEKNLDWPNWSGEKTHSFSTDGKQWTNLDIIEYLVAHFAPRTGVCEGLSWSVVGMVDTADFLTGHHSLDGLTLRDALNTLCDRRRGLSWQVSPGAGASSMLVTIWSAFDEDVKVGDITLAGNPCTVEFAFDQHARMKDVVVWQKHSARASKIIVQGARVVTTCTLDVHADRLIPGWEEAEETAYRAAAGPDLVRNELIRALDGMERVYSYFELPGDWTWVDFNGANVAPAILSDGTLDASASDGAWGGQTRILGELPLIDLSTNDGIRSRYRAPFAMAPHPQDADKWLQLDRPGGDPGGGAFPSCSVVPSPRKLAVLLRTGVPHILGKGHFDPTGDAPSTVEPVYDYEQVRVTCSFELDQRVRVVEEMPVGSHDGPVNEILIPVPSAEMWYIVPGTIEAIKDDGTLQTHAGGLIRDDSDILRAVAALAKSWYGKPRAALDCTLNYLATAPALGQIVTGVFTDDVVGEVNSMVTQVSHDCTSVPFSTRFTTQFFELDPAAMVL